MFNLFSKNHLKQFNKGDNVEIITCPRRGDNADAYKGIKGEIQDIELIDTYKNGKGSIVIRTESSIFVATGIIGRLKMKKLN